MSVRLVATILSARLMMKNVWLPMWIGLWFLCAALALPFFLPRADKSESEPLDDASNDDVGETDIMESDGAKTTLTRRFQNAAKQCKDGTLLLFVNGNRHTVGFLAVLMTTTLAWQTISIIPQLARKRYQWSWSQVRHAAK